MSYEYYNTYLIGITRFLDPRILDTDLFLESRSIFVNQKKFPCECVVENPDLVTFKYKKMKDVGLSINHEVLCKNVIKMQGDYCLTYSEARQFNSKHNLVNLDISVEFLLGEKVEINVFKTNYGIILKSLHYKASGMDDSYDLHTSIPTVAVSDFRSIPFGEIFAGCFPETIQMFEDFYSGELYMKKVLKK